MSLFHKELIHKSSRKHGNTTEKWVKERNKYQKMTYGWLINRETRLISNQRSLNIDKTKTELFTLQQSKMEIFHWLKDAAHTEGRRQGQEQCAQGQCRGWIQLWKELLILFLREGKNKGVCVSTVLTGQSWEDFKCLLQ